MSEINNYADVVRALVESKDQEKAKQQIAEAERKAAFVRECQKTMGVCLTALTQAHNAGLLASSSLSMSVRLQEHAPRAYLTNYPGFFIAPNKSIMLDACPERGVVCLYKGSVINRVVLFEGSAEDALPHLLEQMALSATYKRDKRG